MSSKKQTNSDALSEKHAQAREGLPEELKPAFDALVADYKFLATIHHKSPFVSYLILADLVRRGWQLPPQG